MYTRHIMFIRALFLTSIASLLYAQTMVEYGALAGRSAGAGTAPNIGKSATDVFGKIQKSLTGAVKVDEAVKPATPQAGAPSTVSASAIAATPKAAPEPILPPDLKELVIGLERADMLKKVGKPWMTISSVESGVLVETCSYRNGADSVGVILRDGKVASISGLENSPAK